jgi:hypothetical protein
MKKLLLLAFIGMMISCGTTKKTTSLVRENELSIRRRYIGEFIDYSYTGPETAGGIHLIWIRTSIFNSFGKISAYGKSCSFNTGEKIYLKRLYSSPGVNGNWEYLIENDSLISYRVSDFKYENNAIVRASF